ncbi:MAG: nitroreductase family protein [Archaeoglobaceae archaeon]
MDEEFLRIIKTRRSIRRYSGKEIPEEEIRKILECAMQAPSAGNEQPWHFIVVRDKVKLKELSEIHPYGKMLSEASAAIVVCCDPRLSKYELPMWIQDCSASTQNILLAARALGIGSCWLGVYPNESRMKPIAKALGIPEDIVVFSVISLGYPRSEDEFFEAERFKVDRIHYERW